jgi:hypothetical protein
VNSTNCAATTNASIVVMDPPDAAYVTPTNGVYIIHPQVCADPCSPYSQVCYAYVSVSIGQECCSQAVTNVVGTITWRKSSGANTSFDLILPPHHAAAVWKISYHPAPFPFDCEYDSETIVKCAYSECYE